MCMVVTGIMSHPYVMRTTTQDAGWLSHAVCPVSMARFVGALLNAAIVYHECAMCVSAGSGKAGTVHQVTWIYIHW
jgi:hypothetical protein